MRTSLFEINDDRFDCYFYESEFSSLESAAQELWGSRDIEHFNIGKALHLLGIMVMASTAERTQILDSGVELVSSEKDGNEAVQKIVEKKFLEEIFPQAHARGKIVFNVISDTAADRDELEIIRTIEFRSEARKAAEDL